MREHVARNIALYRAVDIKVEVSRNIFGQIALVWRFVVYVSDVDIARFYGSDRIAYRFGNGLSESRQRGQTGECR